jgi:hypothetical protein
MPFTTNLEGKAVNNSIANILLSIGQCFAAPVMERKGGRFVVCVDAAKVKNLC